MQVVGHSRRRQAILNIPPLCASTASRKNKLYYAFRELGRVVRTAFLLDYISNQELRRIIQAAQNKCEGFNKFAQWAF